MATLEERIEALAGQLGDDVAALTKRHPAMVFGGQFLLDPNEINGWGTQGPYDNSLTQDLGNVGATLSRLGGGFCFPYDVKILSLYAWHRNNNNTAEAWGWVMARQEKNDGSNTVTNTFILDESSVRSGINNGIGLRNYLSTNTQHTSIDLSGETNNVLPAGDTLVLGVGAPTAVATNYYVQVFSGYIEVERV